MTPDPVLTELVATHTLRVVELNEAVRYPECNGCDWVGGLVKDHAAHILALKKEALAKHLFRYGNPNLTGEEHDRLLGMWEEVDEMVRTVWMDLAEAAYAYLADEIDTAAEQHSNGRIAELEATVARVEEAVNTAAAHRFDFDNTSIEGPGGKVGGPNNFFNGNRYVTNYVRAALEGES